jgi:hypothetical protein
MTPEKLLAYEKEELPGAAQELTGEDIRTLVKWLAEKDDKIRYPSFLLLVSRSGNYPDVYPYWDVFVEKLSCPNAYQRSIGLQLMAENARWDEAGRMDAMIDEYLAFCDDNKPVVVRLCIQGLAGVVPHKRNLWPRIVGKLTSIDIAKRRESQRKLVLLDIISVLAAMRKLEPRQEFDDYLFWARESGFLDKKAQKEIDALLENGA